MLPVNSHDPQSYGRVISIGDDVPKYKDSKKNIKIDDVIMMHPQAAMAITMENSILAVVKYPDVYCIITDEKFKENLEEMVITGSTEGHQTVAPAGARPLIQPVS